MGGRRQGFADDKGRGKVFFGILDYLRKRTPKVFVLENVKGITTLEGGKCLRSIIRSLKDIGLTDAAGISQPAYNVYHKVLNTKDHGIPQNRPRWYCIGILKELDTGHDFTFPTGISCPPVNEFLLSDTVCSTKGTLNGCTSGTPNGRTLGADYQSQHVADNFRRASSQIQATGADPSTQLFIVDCDASPSRMSW